MTAEFSKNFQTQFPSSVYDDGTLTGSLLDSAFVFETSGDAIGVYFVSPVSQTSGTLTINAYVTADSATSSDFNVQMRNGPIGSGDTDRPESGGSTIGTPGSDIDLNGTANTWVTFNDITGLTLVAGQPYFLLIENKSATPGTDNATIATRAALDALPDSGSITYNRSVITTNGFTGDPTLAQGQSPIIIKFNDSSLMGNPYVRDGTGPTGVNYRGNRIVPVADMVVSGMRITGTSSSIPGVSSDIGIYQSGSSITNDTISRAVGSENLAHRHEPATLTGGTVYDFILRPNLSNTIGIVYDMGGGTVPTDVKNCRFNGATYVTGATPSTLTEDDEAIINFTIIIDSFESGGGGGSASVLGQNGLGGGMQ